jgi:hypothetical protein
MKKQGNISAIPYAGIIQVRFNGYPLRPQSHPCKKLYVATYRRNLYQSQELTILLRGISEKLIFDEFETYEKIESYAVTI